MPLLFARFELSPTSTCLLSLPENTENPIFSISIGDFKIDIEMILWKTGKLKNETNWIYGVGTIILKISKEESEHPPEVIITPEGQKDLAPRGQYLRERLPKYKEVALETVNRVLKYFQYKLLTPSVQPLPSWYQNLNMPKWIFEGEEIRGLILVQVPPIPNFHDSLGSQKLTQDKFTEFTSFIQNPTEGLFYRRKARL